MAWTITARVEVQLPSFLTTSLDGYEIVSFPPVHFKSLGSPKSLVGRFVIDEYIVLLPGFEGGLFSFKARDRATTSATLYRLLFSRAQILNEVVSGGLICLVLLLF